MDNATKSILENAVRMLDAQPRVEKTEDIVLMVYNLGCFDGAIKQTHIDEEAEIGREIEREIAQQGTPS